MRLPIELQKEIIEFFESLPGIDNENGQKALILKAGLDSQLEKQIDFGKPLAQFIPLLILTLLNYGTLEDGRNALKAVLLASKDLIGPDKRAICDALIKRIDPNNRPDSDEQTNQYEFYNHLAPSHFMETIRVEGLHSMKILCFTGKLLLTAIEEKLEEFIQLRQIRDENLEIAIYIALKHPGSESLRRAAQIEETVKRIKRLQEYENVNIQYCFYQALPSHRGIICEDYDGNRTAYLSSYEWLPYQKNQASRYAIVVGDSLQNRHPMITMLDSWISHYWGKGHGKLHTIVFDFDDTLAPTMKIQIKAWIEALNNAVNNGDIIVENFSPELREAKNDPRTYFAYIQDAFIRHQMADKIITALLPGLQNEHIKEVINTERFRIREKLLEDVDLFKGVADKLFALQKQYHLAIVTATSSKLVRGFLRKKGIVDYFTLILGKDDPQYRWDKVENKASLLLEVSGQMGIPLDRLLYIGDNASDYLASKQLGVRFIEAAQTAKMVNQDSLIQSSDINNEYRFESFENDNTLDNILAKISNSEIT
ncbi:MAG: HAD hydrolase-like protein [Candidatus Vecturithrix sp.]|jgi:phosphoglycolate phosphatase-like HAD superfamily hydrolase|nr:HAD hydrolase-like protein [Candidatus Vecturithrix sp.]